MRIEAEALRELAERIDGPMAQDFIRAVECLDSCGGRVVVTGMGKSGIIARKIAATLSSTGTPAPGPRLFDPRPVIRRARRRPSSGYTSRDAAVRP